MSEQEKPVPEKEETPTDEQQKEPVHYATRSQRVMAWIAAIGMIIITLAYVYALATGALFKA
ncbi:MAG: hypothetical protein HFF09_01690 [Oscillospiraceae bacterium]|nr:hypothetical protein [Oscillospiraceae bacterium]